MVFELFVGKFTPISRFSTLLPNVKLHSKHLSRRKVHLYLNLQQDNWSPLVSTKGKRKIRGEIKPL